MWSIVSNFSQLRETATWDDEQKLLPVFGMYSYCLRLLTKQSIRENSDICRALDFFRKKTVFPSENHLSNSRRKIWRSFHVNFNKFRYALRNNKNRNSFNWLRNWKPKWRRKESWETYKNQMKCIEDKNKNNNSKFMENPVHDMFYQLPKSLELTFKNCQWTILGSPLHGHFFFCAIRGRPFQLIEKHAQQ